MSDNNIILPAEGERVFISNPLAGIFGMQVCVLPEVTDEEILERCNKDNPSGTSAGWSTVINSAEQAIEHNFSKDIAPVPCKECPGRIHKIVIC